MSYLGYDYNNPGNIRYNPAASPWQGLHNPPFVMGPGGAFCWFDTAAKGIRAVARTLIFYRDHLHKETMRDVFATYAPVGDGVNNPEAYAQFVAGRVGVGIDDEVDIGEYRIARPMLAAIFRMENGTEAPYDEATWREGLADAGIRLPAEGEEDSHGPAAAVGEFARDVTAWLS